MIVNPWHALLLAFPLARQVELCILHKVVNHISSRHTLHLFPQASCTVRLLTNGTRHSSVTHQCNLSQFCHNVLPLIHELELSSTRQNTLIGIWLIGLAELDQTTTSCHVPERELLNTLNFTAIGFRVFFVSSFPFFFLFAWLQFPLKLSKKTWNSLFNTPS